MNASTGPLRVHGSKISYFTGKLEAYLRYKEIDYVFVPMTAPARVIVRRRTGTSQMPAVELPDGRWMTDTTPMIAWLETQKPEPAVIPGDPLLRFASLLLEDYADEWLWRPALHHRWSHRGDALLLSRRIVEEMLGDVPLPRALLRFAIRRRQVGRYVRGDGVTASTRAHVEGVYLRALDALQPIFAARPFLLGERPTIADFGFFASMFRHFGLDPTPAAIMLERAPAVFAWLARVWNARGATGGPVATGVPGDWAPILRDAGASYLPYLAANAAAWKARERRFDFAIEGATYRSLPVSRYRVWCLERLRAHFEALSGDARAAAERLLREHGAWDPLWRADAPDSGYDAAGAPFARGIGVFER